MERFIGREQELNSLESAYRKDGFQMAVVYGRRRIGKTTLLRKFCEGKKSVFYTAIKTTPERNAELLGKCVLNSLEPGVKNLSLQGLENIFEYLGQKSECERIVFVIDELPYIVKKDRAFTSLLQKYIDEQWQFGQMYLIVCGSSLSFMEDEVLSEKSPLFGRRTMQIRLEPFSYLQTARFFPSWTREQQAVAYGITGGIAKYLSLIDQNKNVDENIQELYFSKTGYLYEEADNLLTQEFREVDVYGRIIETIASGANHLNEIADKTGFPTQNVLHALKNLMETGIVDQRKALTEEKNKKKTMYVLADEMLRFWYSFIPDAVDMIEAGNGSQYYMQYVKPRFNTFMGTVFEKMCRQYLISNGISGNFLCSVTKVGTWWGTNPQKHEETDIDVVGLDKQEKSAVIGECKYRNEQTDRKVYESLLERSKLLHQGYIVNQYILFSLSGFSTWLEEEARRNKTLKLIRLEDMYDS